MKFIIDYFYYRRRVMLVMLLIIAVFVLFMGLYGIPVMAYVYALSACLLITLAAGVVDFVMYFTRSRKLLYLMDEVSITMEHLPESQNEIENSYQKLLKMLFTEYYVLNSKSEKRHNDTLTYFGMWTHQIKTPISAMSLILREQDTDESRELSENLRDIEQYVSMVLYYVQLESESIDFVIREVSLDKIIKNAIHKFSPQFIRKKIELVYEPLNVEVLTDEKWLQFVIEQLISNALKYIRKGQVKITLGPFDTLIIHDTGIGIAPDDLPRVFECGFTGANGRLDKKATGIGLYLCKRICDALNHKLAITSDEDGTDVFLNLSAPPLDTRE